MPWTVSLGSRLGEELNIAEIRYGELLVFFDQFIRQ